MLRPGPLRDAMISELAFRSIAEEKATRAISYIVATARTFTQWSSSGLSSSTKRATRVSFASSARAGVPESELGATIEQISGADSRAILEPLEDFAFLCCAISVTSSPEW